jgi:hypothetical protein
MSSFGSEKDIDRVIRLREKSPEYRLDNFDRRIIRPAQVAGAEPSQSIHKESGIAGDRRHCNSNILGEAFKAEITVSLVGMAEDPDPGRDPLLTVPADNRSGVISIEFVSGLIGFDRSEGRLGEYDLHDPESPSRLPDGHSLTMGNNGVVIGKISL